MKSPAFRPVHAALMVGLAGMSALPSKSWSGPLDSNRKLILTDAAFPADKYILDQACIMVELYYRMDEDEALLYDPEQPEVVFGKIPLRNLNARQADDSLFRAAASIKQRVKSLVEVPGAEWSDDQKAFRKMFPPAWSGAEALASAQRLVWHRGMRKSFRMSLETSYQYQPLMDSAFRAEGVPTRLKFLAHVESRYNPEAVSPVGAAGIWQFLKSSGQRFLVINDRVDQRMDPHASTLAAARFLRLCHGHLQSWPLAIMAYNSGPGQISDAVEETGSADASDIIQNYQAGGFGTVSKNYYAMFLAASSLGMRAEKLFPVLHKQSPMAYKTLKLEHEWTPRQLRILSGYSSAVIMRYNPSLRPIVFENNLPVPKGFELKLPIGLPTSQDLQFADLRIGGDDQEVVTKHTEQVSFAGFPVPPLIMSSLERVRNALFPGRSREDIPVMAYLHSQGLLDADRLALAKQDRILIEPHPALHAMIRGMGG